MKSSLLALLLVMTTLNLFSLSYNAKTEANLEWATLKADIKNQEVIFSRKSETYNDSSLVFKTDKDPLDIVLRRTIALKDDLISKGTELPSDLISRLQSLQKEAEATGTWNILKRKALFQEVISIRRQIAFANPLVAQIDDLLFIKRDIYKVYEHCCDQYYGYRQYPGGGIFTLANPFGNNPKLTDFTDTLISNNKESYPNPLTKKGSYLSPTLDYDGNRLAFSFVEIKGKREIIQYEKYTGEGHFPEGFAYHVYTANMDGSDLKQITTGMYNDIYPCWTPAGRLAFITERRGGYLRCGRECPNYTLYDMKADGTDIRCLSFHEVNEWSPAIANDGRIIWTRWDYIDRHGCVAHVPWYTTPDGRDPRPIRGNYSIRKTRPDMDIDTKAIPNSSLYVSTAAPHHGQAFGSLTIIDPSAEDDDKMAPTKRFTPEIGFPESEVDWWKNQVYGNAWPLSEDYHLVSYCPYYSNKIKRHHFGLYLVDKFGNKELIYRDKYFASLTPIPIRATKRPPIIPEQRNEAEKEATVSLLNVYDTYLPWPEDKPKIKNLRIWQIYPMSVSSAKVSRNMGIQIPEGSDSINLARSVLGTVPVHEDGSAHFKAPAGVELFFQALDEKGRAVQSMRSGTAFVPGENLSCIGCHEPKKKATINRPIGTPLALKLLPSEIKKGPEGSHPFSYPILVQPILDKHCISCHDGKQNKIDLTTKRVTYPNKPEYSMNKPTPYYTSYVTLAKDYGFTSYGGGYDFDNPNFYRTTPGNFGARASKLYPMLEKGHKGVQLNSEELERIAIWLDSVSQFYGVYETEGMNTQLEGGVAYPTLE